MIQKIKFEIVTDEHLFLSRMDNMHSISYVLFSASCIALQKCTTCELTTCMYTGWPRKKRNSRYGQFFKTLLCSTVIFSSC